jgi:hypothetical protein
MGTIMIVVGHGCLTLDEARYNPAFDANLISVGSIIIDEHYWRSTSINTRSITAHDGCEFEATLDRKRCVRSTNEMYGGVFDSVWNSPEKSSQFVTLFTTDAFSDDL